MLSIRSPLNCHVPVPIGPSFPRADREESRARYCRLMLILFKPWQNAADLREPGQAWPDAFDDFMGSCPERHQQIMTNMQLLHECKDSKDDH
ncbi:hypothetical protein BOTBODRAFT_110916, partial [Botryobasidium botryosum FD-172 SS1]